MKVYDIKLYKSNTSHKVNKKKLIKTNNLNLHSSKVNENRKKENILMLLID